MSDEKNKTKSRTHLSVTLPYCQQHDYHSLLDIALNVRMTATGAMERSLEAQKKDVEILRYALALWRKSINQNYKRFDGAVKELILAALDENRSFLIRTRLQKLFDDLPVEGIINENDQG